MRMKISQSILFIAAVHIAVLGAGCSRTMEADGSATPTAQSILSEPSKPDIAALKARAGQGDAAAQAQLARAYVATDRGLPNYKEAAHWSALAATNGNPDAQTLLGELYLAGQGVGLDPNAGVQWLTRAADAGWVPAQYDLGYLYETGNGAPKNGPLAAKWFLLAAQGGDALAQFNYGQRCMAGLSVQQDPIEGLKWLLLAQAQGQADATARVAELQSSLPGDQVAEAKKRAAAFSPRKSM